MGEQLLIDFALIHARRSDPRTSRDAARAAERFAASQAGRVLACLLRHGPQSKTQLAGRTGLTDIQCDRRLPDLERAGLARPTCQIARSTSGNPERVWAAC